MTLFKQIAAELVAARKARTNPVQIELLKAVVNRVQSTAKSELRDATDEDATDALKYYLKGAQFTVSKMAENGLTEDDRFGVAQQEVALMEAYLPKKLGDVELLAAIRAIGGTNIGAVMKGLRAQFGDGYDAGRAKELFTKDISQLVKV